MRKKASQKAKSCFDICATLLVGPNMNKRGLQLVIRFMASVTEKGTQSVNNSNWF